MTDQNLTPLPDQSKTRFIYQAEQDLTALAKAVAKLKETIAVYVARQYAPGQLNAIVDENIERPNTPVVGTADEFHAAMAVPISLLASIPAEELEKIDVIRIDY